MVVHDDRDCGHQELAVGDAPLEAVAKDVAAGAELGVDVERAVVDAGLAVVGLAP